jgi:hypothetical protein
MPARDYLVIAVMGDTGEPQRRIEIIPRPVPDGRIIAKLPWSCNQRRCGQTCRWPLPARPKAQAWVDGRCADWEARGPPTAGLNGLTPGSKI